MWYTAKAEDEEDSDYEGASTEAPGHSDWVAAVKGRATEAKPPRFNIEQLRPWELEVMFAVEFRSTGRSRPKPQVRGTSELPCGKSDTNPSRGASRSDDDEEKYVQRKLEPYYRNNR